MTPQFLKCSHFKPRQPGPTLFWALGDRCAGISTSIWSTCAVETGDPFDVFRGGGFKRFAAARIGDVLFFDGDTPGAARLDLFFLSPEKVANSNLSIFFYIIFIYANLKDTAKKPTTCIKGVINQMDVAKMWSLKAMDWFYIQTTNMSELIYNYISTCSSFFSYFFLSSSG